MITLVSLGKKIILNIVIYHGNKFVLDLTRIITLKITFSFHNPIFLYFVLELESVASPECGTASRTPNQAV